MFSRRQWLSQTGCGFGSLALAGLAHADAGPGRGPHHPAKAKRVIFLFMQGGVSQVDSYDRKPILEARDGQQMPFPDDRTIANSGVRAASGQRVMKSPWKFQQWGTGGRWATDLFPETNARLDDLCVVNSLHTEGIAHGPATLFLHCGNAIQPRPSMGAWVNYGLGATAGDLPGFVSIAPSGGNGGARNYGPAFLPPVYQGTPVGRTGSADGLTPGHLGATTGDARRRFDLLRELHAEQLARTPGDRELEAVAESYELAWRMQANAPEAFDIGKESKETLDLYGVGRKPTDAFGRQCLLARRLAERGVRFIQVTYGDNTANPAWDQHSNLPKHADHAKATDRPVAALLTDLKRRGLLEDTLVWWGGEFGRTPYAEKNGTGRDHNPGGFTVWLAGGGVKPGLTHGATDEFGHKAVTNKVHMHDLHATVLHLLGLDHEKLTFRHAGRDFRLTDVHGRVVSELFA